MNEQIGRRIQELRKLTGMTQEQLAEKINISRQTLSKWETGATMPDVESIVRLCEIFQITPNDLLDINEKSYNSSDKITLEDLAKMNRYNRKVMLYIIVGVLFLMVSVMIFAVCIAVESATVSTQYMLYRYIVAGEYANAPIDYSLANNLAMWMLIIGIGVLISSLIMNRIGNKSK